MPATADILPAERIQNRIVVLRGKRVLLDADLAAIYEVPTKRLNEQVNRRRAPALRSGATRFARDHLRASRSVSVPVEPANKRKIGYHNGNR